MIGATVSHYRIVEQLGQGGMGVVYRAEDLKLGRMVALKFLAPDAAGDRNAVARMIREARTASSHNHPNICTIYEIDEHEGQPFIAMELVDGGSLASTIAGRPLDTRRVLDLGVQIADALEAAHTLGVIHRDIKPANILVTPRGQVKILDFGLAKPSGDQPSSGAKAAASHPTMLSTQPGMVVGTIAYMSPEQARGERLDRGTDLFSFGLVLYEMATGRQAFDGTTTAVVYDAILNREPAPPRLHNPAIPLALETIIFKAIEKDRDLRYQSAADMRADLERLRRASDPARASTQIVPSPRPADARGATGGPTGRWKRVVGIAAGATVAALLLTAAFIAGRNARRSADTASQAQPIGAPSRPADEPSSSSQPAAAPARESTSPKPAMARTETAPTMSPVTEIPAKPARDFEGYVRLVQDQMREGKTAEAFATVREMAERFKDDPRMGGMLLRMAQTATGPATGGPGERLRRTGAVRQLFTRLSMDMSGSPVAAAALAARAILEDRMRQPEAAALTLQELSARYPDSPYLRQARQQIQRRRPR